MSLTGCTERREGRPAGALALLVTPPAARASTTLKPWSPPFGIPGFAGEGATGRWQAPWQEM